MFTAKATTNVVGLAVLQNPQRKLTSIYQRILQLLSAFPATCFYRQNTERIISDRLRCVQEEVNVFDLEKRIGRGEVEELYIQAKNEYSLASKLYMEKSWEDLMEKAPNGQYEL